MGATAWAHLPNAALIDEVLASVRAHPEQWDAAWDAARYAAWSAARDAAWDAARGAAWDAAWDAARGAARGAAWGAAWDAIAALIAWDDAVHVYHLHHELVNGMRDMDHRAMLLCPAVLAMHYVNLLGAKL